MLPFTVSVQISDYDEYELFADFLLELADYRNDPFAVTYAGARDRANAKADVSRFDREVPLDEAISDLGTLLNARESGLPGSLQQAIADDDGMRDEPPSHAIPDDGDGAGMQPNFDRPEIPTPEEVRDAFIAFSKGKTTVECIALLGTFSVKSTKDIPAEKRGAFIARCGA